MKQMTKAEAIRILEQSCPKRPQKLWSIKRKEAVKMAIEALKKQDDEPDGCYGCVHERHGNQVCDACARSYLDRYVGGDSDDNTGSD